MYFSLKSKVSNYLIQNTCFVFLDTCVSRKDWVGRTWRASSSNLWLSTHKHAHSRNNSTYMTLSLNVCSWGVCYAGRFLVNLFCSTRYVIQDVVLKSSLKKSDSEAHAPAPFTLESLFLSGSGPSLNTCRVKICITYPMYPACAQSVKCRITMVLTKCGALYILCILWIWRKLQGGRPLT